MKDFGSPDCSPSQDRKRWWLFEGRVYAPCVVPEHKMEGRIVWNPDADSAEYISQPPYVERLIGPTPEREQPK